MQILSSAVYWHSSPTKKPLLRMLWWDSVAPFGKPVVPEVYWMLIASSAESSIASSFGLVGLPAGLEESVPFRRAEENDLLQVGAARADLGDHRGVVGGLQSLGGDEQPAAGLVEHELELAGPVGGVDVDQDRADLGGGVLGEGPLGAVRRPDPDAVALGDARVEEAEGEGVDFGVQSRVAQPDAGRQVHQGEPVGVAGDRAVQVLADGVAEQRCVADRRRVALLRHAYSPRSRRSLAAEDAWLRMPVVLPVVTGRAGRPIPLWLSPGLHGEP